MPHAHNCAICGETFTHDLTNCGFKSFSCPKCERERLVVEEFSTELLALEPKRNPKIGLAILFLSAVAVGMLLYGAFRWLGAIL